MILSLPSTQALLLCALLSSPAVPATGAGRASVVAPHLPQSPEVTQAFNAHIREGSRHLQAGDFDLAVEEFAAALELRPNGLQAAFLLGTAQRGAGDLDAAEATFEALSTNHPDAPNGPFGLGQVRLLRGDAPAAEESLREAVRRDPDYLRAWFFLGEALQAQERPNDAADAYREALQRNPAGLLSALALARILLAHDGAAEAFEVLGPIRASFPDDDAAISLSSVALAQLGRFDEAFAMIEGSDVDADAWFNLGLSAARADEWRRADDALGRALQVDPGHLPARLLLSELREAAGNPNSAEAVLQEGIELVDDDTRLRRALAALYMNRSARQLSDAAEILRGLLAESPDDDDVRRALATVYADTGRLDEALPLYQELEPRHPTDPEIAYRLGYLHSHLGDNDAARAGLQRALQLDPGMIDAIYELGVLDLREQRFEQSVERLEQVVQQEPYRTGAFVNLARALRGLGREQEAQQAAVRARELQLLDADIEAARTELRLRPEIAANYLALAELLIQTGERVEARSLLQTALRLDPGLQEARDLLERIRAP